MTTDYESIHDKLVDFIKTRGKFSTKDASDIIKNIGALPKLFKEIYID